jgi:hypothetical protein
MITFFATWFVLAFIALVFNYAIHHNCLILGAFMEFIMDCTDAGIDPRTLDLTGIMNEKLDELEDK